ncbi:MAG TPA: prolyl oligopeptidase family serine peptidase [Chthonomonadaceae bacterium]|nr:prolyl oligopeptidase family serine peptidase [Chthonomonadaceae bacterium]
MDLTFLHASLPISTGSFMALAGLFCAAARTNEPLSDTKRLRYPDIRKSDQTDDYHGVTVADPCRWLEDTDSPETRAWITAESRLTSEYLAPMPGRDHLHARLGALWNYEKWSVPAQMGGRYFFNYNTGLQNQPALYVLEALDATPRLLLDPNTLSPDGTVALSYYGISENGKYLAYALSKAGSDWQEWRVRDVDTGEDHSDLLQWVKFSGAAWTHDHKGFFYCRYDAPPPGEEFLQQNFYHKIYYHRLGTLQEADPLIYERPDQKEWYFGCAVTGDGRYLMIGAHRGTDPKSHIFIKDLLDPASPAVAPEASPVRPLLHGDAAYQFIDNDGPLFWFLTDKEAPRKRVIALEIDSPQPANWREIVPEGPNPIEKVGMVADRFLVCTLQDAHTQVNVFSRDGRPMGEVALPGIGSAYGFDGRRQNTETFYSFTSFTRPETVYHYDAVTGKSILFRAPKLPFDPDAFETQQVFYASKDGTRIPMFLTGKKGLPRDENTPVLLYGYGGFNVSLTPSFSPSNLAWMEMGGLYAVANLRGGGEYGEEWHQAGMKANKPNVFDDFIAAAEWLIANRITSTPKLAISGGSNGGLLVGACLTQRPDLFGAALPHVGVMDMLRFHKFTVGWGWTSDYGSADDPEEFKVLYAYSPLHNIRPGVHYPPTMIFTSDHDDRVVPGHSFKFAAALQAAQAGDAPILIRIETDAGHGAGKPISKQIEVMVDALSFLTHVLNMPPP